MVCDPPPSARLYSMLWHPPPVPACGSATRLGTGSVSRSLAPLHHTIQRSSNVCTSHQHSISHIAACTSRYALLYPPSPCLCIIRATLPEMVVERGIVENHSVACILIKRTNASSLCGASYALWKSQGWLKAALVALHLLWPGNANCDIKACNVLQATPPILVERWSHQGRRWMHQFSTKTGEVSGNPSLTAERHFPRPERWRKSWVCRSMDNVILIPGKSFRVGRLVLTVLKSILQNGKCWPCYFC